MSREGLSLTSRTLSHHATRAARRRNPRGALLSFSQRLSLSSSVPLCVRHVATVLAPPLSPRLAMQPSRFPSSRPFRKALRPSRSAPFALLCSLAFVQSINDACGETRDPCARPPRAPAVTASLQGTRPARDLRWQRTHDYELQGAVHRRKRCCGGLQATRRLTARGLKPGKSGASAVSQGKGPLLRL